MLAENSLHAERKVEDLKQKVLKLKNLKGYEAERDYEKG